MLSTQEMQAVVDGVVYRPGWWFEVSELSDYKLLKLKFFRPDRDTEHIGTGESRPALLDSHTTEVGLVQACLGIILDVEEHEARERFLYKGERVFDPHRKSFSEKQVAQ